MPFADCRKIVKQGDTLKIRWLDSTGLTISCDVYDPAMNKVIVSMVENPAGSGIYELSYAFNAGNGDYLFVINGVGLQVSCISEFANIDAKISDVKVNTDKIPFIDVNITKIKSQTDKIIFDSNGKILAAIDDSGIAKYDLQKRQTVEMDRIRLHSRRR